jgi:peptide/nickel transport system permease protein
MGFKIVILWTDAALWTLLAVLLVYIGRVAGHAQRQATWRKVGRDASALCAGAVLLLFIGITALDSVHFRRALPAAAGQAADERFYDSRTESLLDLLLARPIAMREATYSAPLACRALTRQPVARDGQIVREHPRLEKACAHLPNPDEARSTDVLQRAGLGLLGGALAAAVLFFAIAASVARTHGGLAAAARALVSDRTDAPLRALWLTLAAACLLAGPVLALMGHYHVAGTDRTGNDVLVLTLKSVRTAFVIGLLSTLATLPLAVVLGVLAGWYRGWVDEAVQYAYTLLSSVPNVLLIAACVLMVQVALDKHPEWFDTGLERADLKVLLLCGILGITGWSTLCRLVRAETLKLRELEFVQAATAFGVHPVRIMARHILPNVVHLVLITTVLGFSELILYEAVLTYVGVGVDASTSSFGSMINLARSEMSRDPVVWWSFAAAFSVMVALVLAANLFADGVRDAFDPRARAMRPRLALRRRPAAAAGEGAR